MINFIKVMKDYDDINVTVQFSGRNEWTTFSQLLAYAFVNAKELSEENDKMNVNMLTELYERVNDLVNELDIND